MILMERVKFDCNCDLVIEMEDMGVGVEEILQYAKGVFNKEDIQELIDGLEKISQTETEYVD